jgi:hypothetical protein
MATNASAGDNRRNDPVCKRSPLKSKVMGQERYTKPHRATGQFMGQKEGGKKLKAVGREKQN